LRRWLLQQRVIACFRQGKHCYELKS
jgi:hypothetical protein